MPILLLGPGKSFGELAIMKESKKLMLKSRSRQASVLCRTKCKFAVMSKNSYQSVLDNVDRRKVERLKDFFRSNPFLCKLPRATINTLHLSVKQKTY